jgi:hypothetical protein
MRHARGRGEANSIAHLSDAWRVAAPLDSALDHFQDAALSKSQPIGVERAIGK